MILLRTYAADNNSAGASTFVSIPLPVGLQDGDLMLAAIAVDSASVEITPPDGWQLVFRTDPSRAISLAVYWKVALGEANRWAFGLSSSVNGQGYVVAYAGADGWEPVELARAAGDVATAAPTVPATATSLDGEALALFVATASTATVTPPTEYPDHAQRTNVDSLTFASRVKASAGAVPSTTASISSGTADAATVLVALRPSVSDVTVDDVFGRLVDGFPRGVERVYDLEPGGDYYKLLRAVALVGKQTIYDLVEVLRREIVPHLSRYVLPDWERVFGLTTSRAAQLGTIPERQAQVLSRWREAAGLGSTRDAITAILGPLLGYDVGTPVQVVTTDRDTLRIEHSYSPAGAITVGDGLISDHFEFTTVDGGVVSNAGARVTLEYASFTGGQIECTLLAPDGTFKVWVIDGSSQALDLLFGAEFAGKAMSGTWQLWVENNAGASLTFIPTVFVEGVQVDHRSPRQETAAAMFDWGVYADPAHIGESGKSADFAAARAAVGRIAFSHTIGNLLQSLVPYPDEDSGAHCAIPDECLPT